MKIVAFEINQPIGKFYVGKIDAKKLIELCSTDFNCIVENKYDIYQRKLNESRVPSLKEYMQYSKATFPNGIILNSKYPMQYLNGELTIEEHADSFFIIDGQHRIEALKYYTGIEPFEVCVVIFESIPIDLQTDIFVTVNSEQRKVNPTVKFNLKGNDNVDTPEKMLRTIAILLNDEKESPLRNRISFSDESIKRDDAKISLATFIRPLVRNVYKEEKIYELKDILYRNHNDRSALREQKIKFSKPLWEYYVNEEDEIIYLMLLNYFTAVSDVLPEDWEDVNSLLVKSSGYEALVMLFFEILKSNTTDMSYDNLFNILKPLSKLKGRFLLSDVGVGQSASVRLFKLFKSTLFNENITPDELSEIMEVNEE